METGIPGKPGSETIFIVDASPTLRDLVSHLVSANGHEPVAFASGQACLLAMETEQPAMVLLDFNSPGLRGDETCRLIKRSPRHADVPVVMMTSSGASSEVMQSSQAGANDFLLKPIRTDQLASKLAAIRAANPSGEQTDAGHAPNRILFIQGNDQARQTMGDALEHAGFQVLYGRDLREGLRRFHNASDRIDGIVVDYETVGMMSLKVLLQSGSVREKRMIVLSGSDHPPETLAEIKSLTGGPLIDVRKQPPEAILSLLNMRLRRLTLAVRSCARVPFFTVAEFRPSGVGDWLSGFSYDLSPGGLFLRTLTPLRMGDALQVRLYQEAKSKPFTYEGVVAWANPPEPPTTFSFPVGMGIKFDALDAEKVAALAAFVGDVKKVAG